MLSGSSPENDEPDSRGDSPHMAHALPSQELYCVGYSGVSADDTKTGTTAILPQLRHRHGSGRRSGNLVSKWTRTDMVKLPFRTGSYHSTRPVLGAELPSRGPANATA